MGIFLRLLFLAAFAWVGFVLCKEAEVQAHLPEPDNSRVVLLFGGAVLDGTVIALILTMLVLPAVGDKIGSFFFNPDQRIEHDPHADAIAKLAQGDPESAIEVYESILSNDPSDTLAISEIARICCRDLGDTARAATVIEHALETEWPHEQSSFLANRLADVYLLQNDVVRARQLLIEIAQNLEGTKYAANALHRIHEVDRSLETGVRAPVYFEGVEEAAPAAEQSEPPART
jgi:tetratricopeptide (TPR) repeat protein